MLVDGAAASPGRHERDSSATVRTLASALHEDGTIRVHPQLQSVFGGTLGTSYGSLAGQFPGSLKRLLVRAACERHQPPRGVRARHLVHRPSPYLCASI